MNSRTRFLLISAFGAVAIVVAAGLFLRQFVRLPGAASVGSFSANPQSVAAVDASNQAAASPGPPIEKGALPLAVATAGEDPFRQFNQWSARYLAVPSAERPRIIGEGMRIARERRGALAELIPRDPRAALEAAVPMAVRQQLPREVIDQLEERVSVRAFYGVLGAIAVPAGQPAIRREVRLPEGKRYDAHVFGERLSQPTTENAVVHGVAVGKAIAVAAKRVRALEPGEIPDVTKPIFESCPVSGKSTKVTRRDGLLPPITEQTPAVEIAGEIHYLCDGGHIHAIEEELVAGEGISGGPVKPTTNIPSTQSTGVRTLLYLRVTFPETNRDPQTEAAAYDMMRQVNDFFVENSYGNVYLLTTVAPLILLPRNEAWYNGGGGDEYDLRTDAQEIARSLGYDTSQYDLDIVAYNGGPGSFGGLGYVGGKGTWLKSITAGAACHELGHNFGLWHANFWDTGGKSAIGDGSNAEYGNSYDTMGNSGAGDLQFNANHKSKINWLDRQNFVHNVTSSGTYRIVTFDQAKLDPGSRYALRTRKDSDRDYWAEFRQKSLSNNRWTKDGVLLNWSSWSNSNGGTQLIDTTPGSPDAKTDAAIVVGRTFSDFESGVHLTPIGKTGTSPEAMDVVVNLGTFPGNQAPLLTLNASSATTALNSAVSFTATATDPDGDAVSYAWDFGDRTFSNSNSAAVSKSWATAGEYLVRCVVSDMKGQIAGDSVVVRVGSPATFRISGLVRQGTEPIPNVHVHNGQTGTAYRGSYTDSDGSYIIAGLTAGSVTLTAALNGFTFAPSGFANPVSLGPSFSTANFSGIETPAVTLSIIDADCSEGSNPGRFRLTRTGSTASALAVNFYAPTGTASRGTDYSLVPDLTAGTPYSTLTIAAGQASLDIVANAADDTSAEGPEYATLELLPGTGYGIGGAQAATLTIIDTDSTLPLVSIEVVDGDASEDADPATLKVSRTGATTNPLTVRFTTAGSATSATDYTSIGVQMVIPAGASSAPITITPVDDTANEGTESVIVSLATNAAYIRTSDGNATAGTINILDNDIATVSVAATDSTATEAGSDTGTFVITRTGDLSQSLTVNYALSGTAHQGVDYAPVPGILTIPVGSAVGSVTITPIDDGLGEPQQTVFLQLRGAPRYAVVTPGSATINLTDNSDVPVVTVGVSDGTVGEPSSTGRFKFTTTGTGSGNITLNYTVSGTATSGVDYTALPGTLSIGRNGTAEVTVTPLNDSTVEGLETVTVTIDPDPEYSLHLETEATLNLADDDQPMVSVSTTNDAFTESSGSGKFWLSRTGATTGALAVSFTLGGTATNGTDFTSVPGAVTIPAGAAGVAVNIAPINDTLAEGTETIILTLGAGSYGIGLNGATHYLADNETPSVQVRFSSSAATGSESVGAVNVGVTLSAAASVPVTVECVINGGTATAGADYSVASAVLVFAPGETSKTVPLTIVDDVYDEASQTVLLKLQNANRAALGTSTYTYTITDNDSAPGAIIAFAGASASGAESISPAPIVVSLSAPQTAPVSVDFVSANGSATDGGDFTLPPATLTFAPGETAKTIPSTIVNDGTLEPNETFSVTLSNPVGATLGSIISHTYTIQDDDAATLTITSTDAGANESGEPASFTLTRTGNAATALVVTVSVSGSASENVDYASIPRSIPMSSDQQTAIIAVSPLDDALGEGNETIVVTVGAGTGYTVGSPNSATATIVDDESSLSIAATDQEAAEAGQEPGVFTITRSGSTASALTVNLNLAGTATSGPDYQPISTPVAIPTGAATATVPITPLDDALAEGAETIVAVLNPGSGYFVGAPSVATVTLADDDTNDPPAVSLVSPTTSQTGIPTGVGLILEATASDDGKPTAPGALTTTWLKVSGPGTVTFADPAQRNTTATFTITGTYVLRFQADDGEFQTNVDVTILVGGQPPWVSQDIGAVGLAGSFSQANGTYVVRGAGANISGTTPDAFRFAYQQLSGDGEITARVVTMTGGNSSAKAGVMIRNTNATTSRLAYMSLYGSANTNDDSSFRIRPTDGAATTTTSASGQNPPYWIRVARAGNSFSGFVSPNGTTWTQIGSTQTVTMNPQVLVGLAVTSNNTAALCTATFDNVSISSWPGNIGADVEAGADLNVTLPSPAPLSGTVTDDAKPDPPAAVSTVWSSLSGPGTVSFADPSQLNTAATFSAVGTYILRLTGDDGEVKTFDDVLVSTSLPGVGVNVSDPVATEYGPTAGAFTVTRTGSTAFSLVVRFGVSGTANPQEDFNALGSAVTLAIGESTAVVDVMPIADAVAEDGETVVLTIEPDPAYIVAAASSATMTLTDPPLDVWRRQTFGADAGNTTIVGDNVDLELDGLPNLLEYAFVGDPFGAGSEQPIFGMEGNDCTLTYRRRTAAVDLVYAIEEFSEANGWSLAPFTEQLLSGDETLQIMKARLPAGSGSEKLIRLRVTRN